MQIIHGSKSSYPAIAQRSKDPNTSPSSAHSPSIPNNSRELSVSKFISLAAITSVARNYAGSMQILSKIRTSTFQPAAKEASFLKASPPITNETNQSVLEHLFQKDFCSPPTVFGGKHAGKIIKNLPKKASPKAKGWTWRTCASECAKSKECEFWILPLKGDKSPCRLLTGKGAYIDKGAHLEGEKDLGCLDKKAPVLGSIKNAYYINMANNTKRRENIEAWLDQTSLTYHRVEAIKGEKKDRCIDRINEVKCRGVAGVALSNLKIIEEGDHESGTTLVLEDDVYVKDIAVLEASISLVPEDWDIIRWNCWPSKNIPKEFPWVNRYVFRTVREKEYDPAISEKSRFYGGAFAMLWKKKGLPKLKEVWSQAPYWDIDGRLTTDKLKSYCVQVGSTHLRHAPPSEEKSDIQRREDGKLISDEPQKHHKRLSLNSTHPGLNRTANG